MPSFDNEDELIAGLQAAPSLRAFLKTTATTEGAGTYYTSWAAAGFPSAGATPPAFSAGSGYVLTKATTGAYPFTNAATNGDNKLLKFTINAPSTHSFFVWDNLWACSGFVTNITTAQNVTTPGTLPAGRNPNTALDVWPFLTVYTAPGATTATWTLTGTDALGNTNRTWTYTHPANAETAAQMMPMFPGGASPASTLGCAQVTSFTCSVSSGTAGNIGISLVRLISTGSVFVANAADVQDCFRTGMPTVFNDSCLFIGMLCGSTTTGIIGGELVIGPALT